MPGPAGETASQHPGGSWPGSLPVGPRRDFVSLSPTPWYDVLVVILVCPQPPCPPALGLKLEASGWLGKCSTTELNPRSYPRSFSNVPYHTHTFLEDLRMIHLYSYAYYV